MQVLLSRLPYRGILHNAIDIAVSWLLLLLVAGWRDGHDFPWHGALVLITNSKCRSGSSLISTTIGLSNNELSQMLRRS